MDRLKSEAITEGVDDQVLAVESWLDRAITAEERALVVALYLARNLGHRGIEDGVADPA